MCCTPTTVTRRQKEALACVLNKFWMTQSVLNSAEIIERITMEAIEDAAQEGIRILELRYAPSFIQTNHLHLSYEKIHGAIVQAVQKSSHLPIAVGLLGTLQRILPLDVCERVCDFVIDHKANFVGLDLADDENARPPKDFEKIFAKAKKAGLHITIHAGEAQSPESARNVFDAIEILGAERIGHGVQIIHDPQVQKFVIDRKVPLEICPLSNWLTNAIPDQQSHPIKKLIQNGVLVTLNSDDPGIFGTSLMADYELLAKQYSFGISDFNRANDIAAQACFLPLAQKQKHWPRPIHKI